jgi:hypothetical protein
MPRFSRFIAAGWRRARGAVLQLTAWVRRPGRASRRAEADDAPTDTGGARGDARTRFWTEFRAGQDEAAARIARRTQ